MSRIPRMVILDEKTVYHVMSRTALDGFPFGDVEKDKMMDIIQRFSRLYFTEVLGICIMDNHFHLVARMYPEKYFSDSDIRERYAAFHGNDDEFGILHFPIYSFFSRSVKISIFS